MAVVATWPSSELTTLAADEPSHIDRRLVRAVHTPHGTSGAGRTKLGGDPEWAASPSGGRAVLLVLEGVAERGIQLQGLVRSVVPRG
jgi:hypothetical protein